MNVPAILIFGYGNPSRGDDALGTEFLRLIEPVIDELEQTGQVELLTDFQLQIEHALDLQHREIVLFVDASISATEPYEFYPLTPDRDVTFTTHEMSPQSVLAVYQQFNNTSPPPCYMLAIRGYEFELGQPLSDRARTNLDEAISFTSTLLERTDEPAWQETAKLRG
ncbi:MAG: hydrogenase maturation protease [Gammaproteobacteria bacterium]|nr:hydrogenase maturation protease [Gammaproteobacteria bacterium]